MDDTRKPIPLVGRVQEYLSLLKRMESVTHELAIVGYVTQADLDKWEKLLYPERARATRTLTDFGMGEKLPNLPNLPAKEVANGDAKTGVRGTETKHPASR